MAFLLQYNIGIVGQEQVKSAFRAIEAEALASNRRTVARLQYAPTPKPRAASTTRGDANAAKQIGLAEARAEKMRQAAAERADRAASAKRAASLRASLAAESALQRQRSAALYAQYRADERAHDKAEKDKTRNTEREAKRRTSIEEREARKRANLAEREAKRQQRINEVAGKRTAHERKQAITGVIGGTASRVASVGRAGVAMAGLGAGAIFATAGHGAMAKSASAAELANQLLGNDASASALKAKKEEVLAAVAGTRGFAAQDVIAGMSKFQGTAGEAPATLKMAPILTQTSLATGANMEDLGDMYASMYAAIRNSNGGAAKSVDQIIAEVERLGRVFGAMGQVGAIELKDVAAVGSEITAAAMSYSGDITSNIQKVGAMMQIAKQTGGAGGMGGAEASTAVQNFANDLVQKKDDVEKYLKASGGGTMFADKSRTKLKSLDVLLPELMAATGGDLVKMGDILNIRGTRGLKGFTEPYQEAYTKAKASGATEKVAKEAGKAAVSKRFGTFAGIEMTKQEVQAKADFRLAESDKMLEERMRKLSNAVGAELLPVITELIPKIAYLIPPMVEAASAFATIAKIVSENPLAGLAAIIGTAFAIELAKANISSLIGSAVNRAAGVSGGGAGGAAGAAGAVGTTIRGALGAAAVGAAVGSVVYEGISVGGRMSYDSSSKEAAAITRDLSTKSGAELETALPAASARLKKLEEDLGFFGGVMNSLGAGSLTEIESARSYIKERQGELASYKSSEGERLASTDKGQLVKEILSGEAATSVAVGPGDSLLGDMVGKQSRDSGISPEMFERLEQNKMKSDTALLDAATALKEAGELWKSNQPTQVSINTSNRPTAPVK